MKALNRKLLRDIWRLRAQLLAICLVMGCGVGAFTMAVSASRSLSANLAAYYERSAFGHVFTHVKRAPLALADRIREVPGVVLVEPRIAADVNLDVPGLNEPAAGRIVSLPDHREPRLNRLWLRRGRLPQPGRPGEVVISEAFADAHGMNPGAQFDAVLNGRLERLTVVGIGLSPEFVYTLRPGSFVPDDRRYGVLWMREEQLAASFDLDGAFNDLVLSASPGVEQEAILHALDALTRPYGGDGAYGRDQQPSHRYVADELEQLRSMASVTPPIFLGVSAMLINIVLSRLIRTQREQIALLRAFGYTRLDIGFHYFSLIAVVAAMGAAIGIGLGAYMGRLLTTLYVQFFRFPVLEYALEPWVGLLAVAATTAAAGVGAFWAVWRAMHLPPAEAMRPEAPTVYGRTILERLGLDRLLSPAARMVLRHLERRPIRSVLSILGVALSVSILALGSFVTDSIDVLMDMEFGMAQRQDVTVTFNEPRDEGALFELRRMTGVVHAEPFRTVPVRLRAGHRDRRESISGVVPAPTLRRVLNERGQAVDVPESGLLVSISLAELLGVEPGDQVTVEVMEGQRPTLTLPVTRVVESYIGTAAYMSMAALNRALGEGPTLTGAHMIVDRAAAPALYDSLKQTPGVASVTIKQAALDSFERTLAENLLRMRLFNLGFACVIAVGVVYNTARIVHAERAHELATLRVLGFYRSEIAGIFLGELAVVTLAALPVGLVLGYGLCAVAAASLQTETHRIPFAVSAQTLAFAGTVVLLAAAVTALFVRHDLDRLDLVEVLKART